MDFIACCAERLISSNTRQSICTFQCSLWCDPTETKITHLWYLPTHSLYSLQLYSLTLISNPFFITSLLAVRFERKSNLFFFFVISNPINQRSDSSTTAVLLQTRLLGTQYASACVTFTDLFSCSSVISTTLGTGSSLFSFGTWNSQSEYIKSCWKMFVIKANGCKKCQDISF